MLSFFDVSGAGVSIAAADVRAAWEMVGGDGEPTGFSRIFATTGEFWAVAGGLDAFLAAWDASATERVSFDIAEGPTTIHLNPASATAISTLSGVTTVRVGAWKTFSTTDAVVL